MEEEQIYEELENERLFNQKNRNGKSFFFVLLFIILFGICRLVKIPAASYRIPQALDKLSGFSYNVDNTQISAGVPQTPKEVSSCSCCSFFSSP